MNTFDIYLGWDGILSIGRATHHDTHDKVVAISNTRNEIANVQVWDLEDFVQELSDALGVRLTLITPPSSDFVKRAMEIQNAMAESKLNDSDRAKDENPYYIDLSTAPDRPGIAKVNDVVRGGQQNINGGACEAYPGCDGLMLA